VAGKLIKSYLTNRHQRTIINNNTVNSVSEWQKVEQGVPQGSILGPLIFLVYINDLPCIINKVAKPILYADDTSILCFKSNNNELAIALRGILELINWWFSSNSLTLNLTKTNWVHFSSEPNTSININMNYRGIEINSMNTVKFLGLIIESTLTWKEHITYIATKLSSASYAIRTLTSIMSREGLLMTYYAYAHSIMSYGIVFWGNSTYSDQIFRTQKRRVRIIMKAGNRDSCRLLFRTLNILPLSSQYIFSVSTFVAKNVDMFITNADIHTHIYTLGEA
jgi:hypothetical protein